MATPVAGQTPPGARPNRGAGRRQAARRGPRRSRVGRYRRTATCVADEWLPSTEPGLQAGSRLLPIERAASWRRCPYTSRIASAGLRGRGEADLSPTPASTSCNGRPAVAATRPRWIRFAFHPASCADEVGKAGRMQGIAHALGIHGPCGWNRPTLPRRLSRPGIHGPRCRNRPVQSARRPTPLPGTHHRRHWNRSRNQITI